MSNYSDRQSPQLDCSNAGAFEELQLFFVFTQNGHLGAGQPQHLRAKAAELAVAEHEDFVARIDLNLFENLKRRGQRLGENGFFIATLSGTSWRFATRH